ncbi:MAG: ATP-binding protein [Deltaproteobacteria bacterium]|nr:ATP-binding protein [Deltaproteobacteria bacterium]
MDTIPIVLQNILDSLSVGILVIDPEGLIAAINRAASEILGHTADPPFGKGWEALIDEDERNHDFQNLMVEVINERKVNLKRSLRYFGANGNTRRLSISGSVLTEGRHTGGIAILINDVTELHHAHEIEKTVLREKSALQHERAESIRNLAEAVAHQIRNPVMSIGGFSLRMLKGTGENDPNRKYVEMILDGSRRLEDVVSAVSSYTKLMEISPRKTLLPELVAEAKKGIQAKVDALSRKIDWNLSLEPIEIRVDPEFFVLALKEIFLNALEFCDEACATIEVQLLKQKNHMHLEIRDQGPGISEANLPFIFDPFFTTKAVGVGMGLCKAKRIISEHKGKIVVKSRRGRGTAVTIRLPGGVVPPYRPQEPGHGYS